MSDCGDVKKVFVPVPDEKAKEISAVPSGFGVTDIAAEKIRHFCVVDKKSDDEFGLLIKVVKDGCSGNSYAMELSSISEARERGDKIFVHQGATAIVDKLSYLFVIGSQLDYVETLLMSGFQIQNPNVKKSCSCGSSFAV
jgi:iron-sulfur cluster assembly accessory protein